MHRLTLTCIYILVMTVSLQIAAAEWEQMPQLNRDFITGNVEWDSLTEEEKHLIKRYTTMESRASYERNQSNDCQQAIKIADSRSRALDRVLRLFSDCVQDRVLSNDCSKEWRALEREYDDYDRAARNVTSECS